MDGPTDIMSNWVTSTKQKKSLPKITITDNPFTKYFTNLDGLARRVCDNPDGKAKVKEKDQFQQIMAKFHRGMGRFIVRMQLFDNLG